MELLLEPRWGLDVNALCWWSPHIQWQATPLHFAVMTANVSLVKVLLENGADVNATDMFSITPLMVAATRGVVMFMLLDIKMDIEAVGDYGARRHTWGGKFVCDDCYPEVMRLLLDNGADTTMLHRMRRF